MANRLRQLCELGQSVWLDYIRRDMVEGGELARMIHEDGLRGMTSNPAIFQKAIAGSDLYDADLKQASTSDPVKIFESLAIHDIRAACDAFRPLYDETDGQDGFVSLEVSPHLAHDTDGTIAEAERLHAAVERPNVMIKVPATPAGLPAITHLIAEGIHVNVTLMFSQAQYEDVAEAFLQGLERRFEAGRPLNVASVASVFISRIDAKVDQQLEALGTDEARALRGKAGVANAKQIYQRFKARFNGARWEALAANGASAQRPLWASTSTKNPDYPDVMYVDHLIGPHTVNTMPPETFEAFRDHGTVADTVEQGLDEARKTLDRLQQLGVELDGVMDELLAEGVDKFVQPFDALMDSITQKRAAVAA